MVLNNEWKMEKNNLGAFDDTNVFSSRVFSAEDQVYSGLFVVSGLQKNWAALFSL